MRKTTGRNVTAHDKWHRKLWFSVRFIKECNIYVACLWHVTIDIPMKHATNNDLMWFFQRRRCCSFLTQSSINFSVKKRQSWYKKNVSTPSVLRFLSAIRYECSRYNHAFTEKAQHLRRWIPLRTFTRGRLIPRQPRAIKRTTRTELRDENIRSNRCVHWNIGIIPTALHRCNIRNDKFIHWNTGITHTVLHRCDIHNGKYIHWNIDIFCHLFIRISALIVL